MAFQAEPKDEISVRPKLVFQVAEKFGV